MDKPTDSGALAHIDKEGQLSISIPSELDPQLKGGNIWCSIVPANLDDRIAILTAFQGATPKLASVMGQPILVTNVGRQLVTITDTESGEVFPAVRTLLFTADNKQYAAVSEGVSASLGMIFKLWGTPPWSPPLPLILRELPRPGAKRWHYLEVDRAAMPGAKSRR